MQHTKHNFKRQTTKRNLYIPHKACPTLSCAILVPLLIFLPTSYRRVCPSISFTIFAHMLTFLPTSYRRACPSLSFAIHILMLIILLISYQRTRSALSWTSLHSFSMFWSIISGRCLVQHHRHAHHAHLFQLLLLIYHVVHVEQMNLDLPYLPTNPQH